MFIRLMPCRFPDVLRIYVWVYNLAPLQNSLMKVRVGDVLFLGRRTLSIEVRDVACSMGAGRDNIYEDPDCGADSN